ncbi:MAG TPA: PQQ-dependent sugar dehydrogenase [Prolixibacteraceae bacterium]|nr:PQQ-dependent sugar dehydrogenase [Prolixibacteraceae bacterium]
MKSLWLLALIVLLSSCYAIHHSTGGGQHSKYSGTRNLEPSDVELPEGYQIEVVARDLTFPTGITFDENGVAYVTESGYSYGEVFTDPKLVRINKDGTTEIVCIGKNNGPWNGVFYYDNYFYVSEGGQLEGGKILRIDRNGNSVPLAEGLPGKGDHHTDGPLVHDGYIYFGQGTATNSGVTGKDNIEFGWLKRFPEFHDIPCKDIRLSGVNYTSNNFLNKEKGAKAETGAYLPFGTPSSPDQVIKGEVPCTGSIMRIPLKGGKPELVAWGFRNPYGMSFNQKGELYVTENGYDDRGSRPVWGTGDFLWKIEPGKWYGWPDYSGGHRLSEGNLKVPGQGKPARLLEEDPGEPPQPVAALGVHSSSNGFDFSRSEDFGFVGEAFIAQFGDMSPKVGKVMHPVGFKVVRVDPLTGFINDFAVNKKKNAPASKLSKGGLERPNAARFSPDGKYLYIVDFGILMTSKRGPRPIGNSGVVWRISKIEKK